MAPPTPASGSAGPSSDTLQQKLDLMIWLTLAAWPALGLAVQNNWGGADTGAKRDWFAGAISELLADTPPADLEAAYVEEVLLQVMQDEFEVVVDDGSPAEVAEALLERRAKILKGDFAEVDALMAKWEERREKGEKVAVRYVTQQDGEEEGDSGSDSGSEGEEEEEEEDVEMGDAPAQEKRKPAPEVDEDGFTKVVGRRR